MTYAVNFSKLLAPRYKLVYQGGHHEVYCDGEFHLRISGNAVGSAPLGTPSPFGQGFRLSIGSCDCENYQAR